MSQTLVGEISFKSYYNSYKLTCLKGSMLAAGNKNNINNNNNNLGSVNEERMSSIITIIICKAM